MGSAASLTDKLDALADALRAAGVDQERMARILGSAAEATMHALVLDAVLDDRAAATPEPDETAVRVDEPRADDAPDVSVPLAA